MATPDTGRAHTWRFRLDDSETLEVAAPPRATEKQVRRRGRISLILGILVGALLVVAVANADNLNNVSAAGSDTITAGGSTTITYRLVGNSSPSGDPSGCNASVSTPVTVTINKPAAVTGTASVTFTGCGPANQQTAAYSSNTPGDYSITHSVSGGVTDSKYNNNADFTLHVTSSNEAPTADAGGPYTGDEGEHVQLDGTGSSDPDDGDVASYSWSVAPASGSGNDPDTGATCGFVDGTSSTDAQPKVACTEDGVYDVALTVTDDDGATDDDATTLTLDNVAPVITSFTCPIDPVAVNTQVTLNGAFTDDGANDTHTASIAWGDGSSSAGTVTQGSGSGTVSGSHAYTAAGIYTPQLTVTDDDEDSDTEKCEYVVVYDPSAGFVTGGGWINSPAGAYLADPTMVGKATFGFVSRYKKGANLPDGNTEFQFHAAGLNFKSTEYQWLVVASSKATYKGWGTINGGGSYGFLLSAIDGPTDKFRIKIWDVGTGDVVYDNNLGGGDDADPATALGGGSIVIHTGGKK